MPFVLMLCAFALPFLAARGLWWDCWVFGTCFPCCLPSLGLSFVMGSLRVPGLSCVGPAAACPELSTTPNGEKCSFWQSLGAHLWETWGPWHFGVHPSTVCALHRQCQLWISSQLAGFETVGVLLGSVLVPGPDKTELLERAFLCK